ncbi:MAG TPA: hypothetical protein VJX23_14660 [Candidatus Binataceae bacterium]|nr:hypothetical protein [Candidatus Binataceae bacterium]
MANIIEEFASFAGRYEGEGIDHTGSKFNWIVTLVPVVGDLAVAILGFATACDGSTLLEEHSIIATLRAGRIAMWTINSNGRSMWQLDLRRIVGPRDAWFFDDDSARALALAEKTEAPAPDSPRTHVFAMGDPADLKSHRIEITIELFPDGDLGYRYAWGQPGGEFADRWSARLRRVKPSPVK